ncbi:type II toxin-antitoxin system RelE/ParE family toxin [Flavobacterium sp.]|uniref:type II toxin-antitoxin system RelE/ParE family toxin n=1 Tax=Flavobacterium sp. TaxID=239 RepID=UPI003D120817
MREFEFSQKSLKEIDTIAEYLAFKWSTRVREKFLNDLNKNFQFIASNPEMFPNGNYKKINKCVVSKQTTIYFKFDTKKITIVTVFDTRRNPNNI